MPVTRRIRTLAATTALAAATLGAVPTPAVAEPVVPIDAGPAPQATPSAPTVRTVAPAKPANAVTAPLTGVFYRSPTPQAPPFVQIGAVVNKGDVIALIEAMKLFNEIKSDVAGRVTRILVESGTLVKRQQPLVEVDPSA